MPTHTSSEVKHGIYRHYKGPLYQVIGVAHDANADSLASTDALEYMPGEWPGVLGERIVVVYFGLMLNGAHFGPRLAVRTLDDFLASICPHESCPNYGSAKPHLEPGGGRALTRSRFRYLGPEFTPAMWRGSSSA